MTVTYKYDANGLRTQKTVNGVNYNYVYEDGRLVYEQKEGEYELNYRYDGDGNLFAVSRYRYSDGRSDILYAVNNTRGDVMELRAGSGEINSRYKYDSWGKLVSVTNANGAALGPTTYSGQNSIRYRGYVYDVETGLYYLQSRYYDPETGRFLNADDVDYIGYSGEQLSYNAFAYCENEPVGRLDADGFITEKINKRLRSGYVNTALNAVLDYILAGKQISQYIEYSRNKNYIYTVIVEYLENKGKHSGKYRKVELVFGKKQQWKDNSKWAANFNDFTLSVYDLTLRLSEDVRDKDDFYGIIVPLVLLLGLLSGEYYKSSQSKQNYNLVWGPKGIDPNNNYDYYLFEVEWQGNSKKEYYVYSIIYDSVRKVVV